MTIFVSPSSKTPVEDAVEILDQSGYQTDPDGREYYFQANEEGSLVYQVYDDGEVIEWSGGVEGRVTPANTLEVTFSC
jgi:hypothetical protein